MSPMIASIDAGGTTGLAIANMSLGHSVTLKRVSLISSPDPLEVLNLVCAHHSSYVVMERRAGKGSPEGVEPYEQIMAHLLAVQYSVGDKLWFEENHITLVSPGIWKPFMKATHLDLGTWCPEDSHQSDALKMLYYAVKFNNMNRKVRLG